MMKKYNEKRAELIDLRNGLVDYLKAFVEYNNSNCMFKIKSVYDSNKVIAINDYPSISISLPQIDVNDTIGSGEDIEALNIGLVYPINVHVLNMDSYEEDEDCLYIVDNFTDYLLRNPAISGSWVFNGKMQIITDTIFDATNSRGILILLGLEGIYHK